MASIAESMLPCPVMTTNLGVRVIFELLEKITDPLPSGSWRSSEDQVERPVLRGEDLAPTRGFPEIQIGSKPTRLSHSRTSRGLIPNLRRSML
jgi:hypothetical protein